MTEEEKRFEEVWGNSYNQYATLTVKEGPAGTEKTYSFSAELGPEDYVEDDDDYEEFIEDPEEEVQCEKPACEGENIEDVLDKYGDARMFHKLMQGLGFKRISGKLPWETESPDCPEEVKHCCDKGSCNVNMCKKQCKHSMPFFTFDVDEAPEDCGLKDSSLCKLLMRIMDADPTLFCRWLYMFENDRDGFDELSNHDQLAYAQRIYKLL